MSALKKELENEDQEQHGYIGVDEGENQSTGLAVNRLLWGDLAFHIPSFELTTAAGGH